MKTIKSVSGFDINVCCASCVHKEFGKGRSNDVARKCGLTNEVVLACHTCDRCQVRPTLLAL